MNHKKHIRQGIVISLFAVCIFASCKKTDKFYENLQNLPEVLTSSVYAYNAAYAIGDTLVLTGRLRPENGLKVEVGGQEAVLFDITTFKRKGSQQDTMLIDQVKLVVTEAMGIGSARPITITSSGNTIQAPVIDIYDSNGAGTLGYPLKIVAQASVNSATAKFFHCLNGKGTVYYYGAGKILRINTDATVQTILTTTGLSDIGGTFAVTEMLAGGVNTAENTLYFSALTTGNVYRFCKLDLPTGVLTTLNRSTTFSSPYEGNIDQLQLRIVGIYPCSNGNVYVKLAKENQYIASLALLSATGRLKYLYRSFQHTDMPGLILNIPANDDEGGNVSADENLLYQTVSSTGVNGKAFAGISVYDLVSRIQLGVYNSANLNIGENPQLIGPFNTLKMEWIYDGGNVANGRFGFLPLPGRKAAALLYQYFSSRNGGLDKPANVPFWAVFDFKESRVYKYAQGACGLGNFYMEPVTSGSKEGTKVFDMMLNYDEQGNLYFTANGKQKIVKTIKN
jgi:hypothetical protein